MTTENEADLFQNVSGGTIGVMKADQDGKLRGVALSNNDQVWLTEREQEATALAPRDPAFNPFTDNQAGFEGQDAQARAKHLNLVKRAGSPERSRPIGRDVADEENSPEPETPVSDSEIDHDAEVAVQNDIEANIGEPEGDAPTGTQAEGELAGTETASAAAAAKAQRAAQEAPSAAEHQKEAAKAAAARSIEKAQGSGQPKQTAKAKAEKQAPAGQRQQGEVTG